MQVEDARLTHNRITNFTVNGIDFSGNDVVIEDNLIANHCPPGGGPHPVCMQGQSGDERPAYHGTRITRNLCIADAGATNETSSYVQGISIHNGRWRDAIVQRSIVLHSSQHPIALYGINDAAISNNGSSERAMANCPAPSPSRLRNGRQTTAVDPVDPVRLERSDIFQNVLLDRVIGRTLIREAQELYLETNGCRS